ncbi:hypothetical protein [Streptosporangium sp. NPDC000396]|uniref:hypothetical protein n=1 Tax=Streptosporangium sp. NPDC000396 TaxID=3366185 RepID=UPI0036C4634E
MRSPRTPRHTRAEAGTGLERRSTRIGLGAGITATTVGLLALGRTSSGMELAATARGFLSFFSGVFALVSLTLTVALGLLSADRVVLPVQGRIRAQLVHRAAALIGMTFLATHVLIKITEGKAPVAAAVVPLAANGVGLYVGLGAIASDVMVLVFATGIIRAGFADARRPWLWRILHGSVYLAWPTAILHGLTAGRQPAGWVTWSYVSCLVAVGAALLIRVISAFRPKRVPVLAETPVEQPRATEMAPPTSIVGRRPRRAREAPAQIRRIGGVG